MEKFVRSIFQRYIFALVSVTGVLTSAAAFATYPCNGVIDAVDVSPSGIVMMDSAQSGIRWVYLCQLGTSNNGVGPESCKAMLSLLLTAQVSGLPVSMSFNDSLTCTSHPQSTWLTGWTVGPRTYNP